tara:strand:+ start:1000 stop:1338 length:339 start_codon:yes stop_codon:yes gene_type:complete
MIWPPAKAWTSMVGIGSHVHFVAINYGGESLKRWIILMSVLDSSVVVKVTWSQLIDSSKWESGWVEINHTKSSKLVNSKVIAKTTNFSQLSNDSGLTIPITKSSIRPWFERT